GGSGAGSGAGGRTPWGGGGAAVAGGDPGAAPRAAAVVVASAASLARARPFLPARPTVAFEDFAADLTAVFAAPAAFAVSAGGPALSGVVAPAVCPAPFGSGAAGGLCASLRGGIWLIVRWCDFPTPPA